MKAYTVLEIGWEYNDEYHSTGNYGETYEAPKKVYLDKPKAKEEWLRHEIKAYKTQNLMSYIGESDISNSLAPKVTERQLESFLKETWSINLDDYEIEVPRNASDEDVIKLIGMLTLRFFKLHEMTITE